MTLPDRSFISVCCYCGCVATGRCVFIGRDNEIIDNPFCKHHETIVYGQTGLSIRVIHEKGLERELIAIQRWPVHSVSPKLPENKAEFVKLASQQLQA